MKAAAKTVHPRLDAIIKRLPAAAEAVRVSAEQIIQNMQTPPVVEIGQKPYRANDVVFFAMVIHRSYERAYLVSTNGNREEAIRLPERGRSFKLAVNRHETVQQFCLMGVPGFLANGRTGKYARLPIVQASDPQLFDRIQWTSAQREAWAWCVKRRRQATEGARSERLKSKGLYYTRPKAGASSPW